MSVLILEADTAFIKSAHLAAIVTAVAGMEAQLRFNHSRPRDHLSLAKLAQLIETSVLPDDLKNEIHELRRFRNKWVHVTDPWDESLSEYVEHPEALQMELEGWALPRRNCAPPRVLLGSRNVMKWFQLKLVDAEQAT
jgi:hypothetical protein